MVLQTKLFILVPQSNTFHYCILLEENKQISGNYPAILTDYLRIQRNLGRLSNYRRPLVTWYSIISLAKLFKLVVVMVCMLDQDNIIKFTVYCIQCRRTTEQTSHIRRASLKDNSRRKRTISIRNAKWRLSAPIRDRCANISLSVSSKMCHNACNCFMTPVGPSI